MQSLDDMELLRKFVDSGSEAAFEMLLQRHLSLVYSAALRKVNNPDLARDVTQTVFILFARKASSLHPATVISGWLYRTTIFAASEALRREYRRRKHEGGAEHMETKQEEDAWEQIASRLEDVMGRLGETDRNAIVLRFFENKHLKEVASVLGITERAAQKRVERAVEKLRVLLTKKQVFVPSILLTTILASHAVQPAPIAITGLGSTALGTVLPTSSNAALLKGTAQLMAWAKLKTTVFVSVALLLAGGGGTLMTISALRGTNQAAAISAGTRK